MNRLKLNCDERKILSVGICIANSFPFEYMLLNEAFMSVDHHKFLGLIFESSSDFKIHLNFNAFNVILRLSLYTTLIRPIFKYR